MHTFSVFFYFFSLNLFCYVFVLFCSVFFSLIFPADTSSILFHLVVENLILHIFLIIMIIMPWDVPECSMFRILSTPLRCRLFIKWPKSPYYINGICCYIRNDVVTCLWTKQVNEKAFTKRKKRKIFRGAIFVCLLILF